MGDRSPLPPLPADRPEVGTVWRHYKGGWYQVVGVGRHSETLEPMVAYVRTNDPTKPREQWYRPLLLWNDEVDTDEGPQPRFRRVR
jgi:hypothetical protein